MNSIKSIIKIELLKDIRFWIVLFFIFRMYAITSPPLEHSHNWRQCTGLMVARNFCEVDNNIFYPRVDDNNGYSGIVGMKFPVINYIIYLVSKVFGFQNWYGRLINLIISSLGIWYFFLLIRRFFNERIAFFSSLILITSIWFMFSRKTMHDTFCISLTFMGLWYGLNYLFDGKTRNFILFFLFILVGILSKIPAIYLLVIFAIPLSIKSIPIRRKKILVISFLPILFIVWYWYFFWNPYLSNEYHLWYNSGKSMVEGFQDIKNNFSLVLERFYFDGLKSYTALATVFIGIFFVIKNKNYLAIWIFVLLTIVFTLYVIKSGTFFSQHDHYIIPYVPVLALFGGYGLYNLNKKLSILLISIIMIEGLLNQQHDFTNKVDVYKLELEKISDKFSKRSDLIVVNGNGNPQELFLSHRKGWTLSNNSIADTSLVSEINNQGCKFIYINKHEFSNKIPNCYTKEYEDENYVIFRISK